VVPLAPRAVPSRPAHPLRGSNYIWSWEINRVMREMIGPAAADRRRALAPLGEKELGFLVDEIREAARRRAHTLVGVSAYSFYAPARALAARGSPSRSDGSASALRGRAAADRRRHGDRPSRVVGLFPEHRIGRRTAISSPLPQKARPYGSPSVDTEAAFLCAMAARPAVARAGIGRGPGRARGGVSRQLPGAARGGARRCRQQPLLSHAALARSVAGAAFDIIWEARRRVKPDPYLAWRISARSPGCGGPRPAGTLRVVDEGTPMHRTRLSFRGFKVALVHWRRNDAAPCCAIWARLGVEVLSGEDAPPERRKARKPSSSTATSARLRQVSADGLARCAADRAGGVGGAVGLDWILSRDHLRLPIKPVRSVGVLTALAVACREFQRRQALDLRLARLEERLRARRFVSHAARLDARPWLERGDAFARLRRLAMERRTTSSIQRRSRRAGAQAGICRAPARRLSFSSFFAFRVGSMRHHRLRAGMRASIGQPITKRESRSATVGVSRRESQRQTERGRQACQCRYQPLTSQEVADQVGLSLTDADIASFIGLMAPSIAGYNIVDAMPDNLPQ